MFAFSSLEQMGIVAVALSIGGIGYYAAILHIVLHSFTKPVCSIKSVKWKYSAYILDKGHWWLYENQPARRRGCIALIYNDHAIPPSAVC
jgi:hydrogenase-4 component F